MIAAQAYRVPAVHPLTLSLILAAGSLAVPAAQAQMSAAQVKAEVAFARGLASEWTFVELAQSVLDGVESEGVTGKVKEELEFVKCEIYVSGARSEPDAIARLELFDRAIAGYQNFIAQNSYSDFKSQAEAGLVNTAAIYGRAIDLALEEVVGDQAAELAKQKSTILEETVNLTQDLIAEIMAVPQDERSEASKRELAGLMLNRGQMLGEIGRIEEDGEYFFSQALMSLEEMIFEFGEDSVPGIRGFKAMGDIYTWTGQTEEAANFYQAIIMNVLPKDPERLKRLIEANGSEFTAEELAFRFKFVELGIPGLVNALLELGDLNEAAGYSLHMYNLQRKEGLNFSRDGYQALLDVARALLATNGYIGGDQANGETRWFATEEEMKSEVRSRRLHDDTTSFALKLANLVNQENKGNILQVRAQKLISEISNRPGVKVSPDVLLQAAQGEYFDGNYDAAIAGMRRVMRALDYREPTERLEYGAQIMNVLANSFRRSERELEAAMAFREGITAWQGDPEQDERNSQGYLAMVKRLAQQNPGDETFKLLKSEAEEFVTRFGAASKGDEINFNRGMREYGEGNYDAAQVQLRKITSDTDFFEKAMVQIAVCDFRVGRRDLALKALEEYIEVYVNDPANALQSEVRGAKRTESLAAAEFFRGLGTYLNAKESNDAATWQRLDELLSDYGSKFPTQDVLVPWTMQLVLEARIALRDLTRAREMIDTLIRDWPDNKRTGPSSKRYYNSLKVIRDQAAAEEKDALLQEMAQFLKLGNELGTPDFQSLRNESRHWLDLGDYAEAERVLAEIVRRYGEQEEHAAQISTYVLPDLGQALLLGGKVIDAKAIYNPLVMDETATPSKTTVLNWSRAVSGWLTGDGQKVQVIAGAGGTEEEWTTLISKLDQISRAGDKWVSCDWYEVKLMIIHGYYAWGQEDDRKLDSAKNQLRQIDSTLDDPSYAPVAEYCEEAPPELRDRLGNDVLRSRYTYMARLLK